MAQTWDHHRHSQKTITRTRSRASCVTFAIFTSKHTMKRHICGQGSDCDTKSSNTWGIICWATAAEQIQNERYLQHLARHKKRKILFFQISKWLLFQDSAQKRASNCPGIIAIFQCIFRTKQQQSTRIAGAIVFLEHLQFTVNLILEPLPRRQHLLVVSETLVWRIAWREVSGRRSNSNT